MSKIPPLSAFLPFSLALPFSLTLPLSLALVLLLSACAGLATPQPTAESAVSPEVEGALPTSQPTGDSDGAIVLTVWVPPSFDPAAGTLSANMLAARLAEFSEQHPQVRLELRVKAEEGTGGLLDSLQGAKAAAPLSVPDLVLLPHTQVSAAVQSQILHPIRPLSAELDSEDWYPFAIDMASVDGQAYGLPFAADALVVAYRPSAVTQVPGSWSALLESRIALGFAAADPEALFAFVQLSAADEGADVEGAEQLFSQDSITEVFEFLASGQDRGVFPFWLSQYQTAEQSWQAFIEGRVPMTVAWTSRVFDDRQTDINGAPIPTRSGEVFTMLRGWVWAVSTPRADRAALAADLAEFLSTPEFIAQWSAASGLLPPRASSLAAWSPDAKQALASQIMSGAEALPDQSVLDLWGLPLSDAVLALLKDEQTAEEAMQGVLLAVSSQ